MNSKLASEYLKGHVSGDSQFIDDRPELPGELHLAICFSQIPYGEIQKIDLSEALKVEGVRAVFTHQDLKSNFWGSITSDQPLLATKKVHYVGEAIAIIAATNRSSAYLGREKIKIDYQPLEPILNLDQAILKKSFIGSARKISQGQAQDYLALAKHRFDGELEIPGQEHFYLESQSCIAYPQDDDLFEIHTSSQNPTEVQHIVAQSLGLKYHQVICVVKRMGGAFGGKESQAAPFAVYAALVAQKLKKPARLVLSREDDMLITGKRNPFKIFYEVGFNQDGKIIALKAKMYSNGGAYTDLTPAIMERAILHLDNAYFIPHFHVEGQVCRTNLAPHTAFRGFGAPKGVLAIESIIEDISKYLKKDSLTIRELNIYRKGQKTPYGQEIEDDTLFHLFKKLKNETHYLEWRKNIDQHNESTAHSLKGLSATAVKFGISFTTKFLNQGSALVSLQTDGSVQVSTGATDMGQGVSAKITQLISECFSIPTDNIRVLPTSTDKNSNTSPTAASSGTDINGQATLMACLELKERLSRLALTLFNCPKELRGKSVAASGIANEMNLESSSQWENIIFKNEEIFDKRTQKNKISFKDLLLEAYLNRICLTSYGYYKYPSIYYNKEKGKGVPFYYYTNGVAVSEVSIDRFTGKTNVLRSEVFIDLGRPYNKSIDHGQVMGGFIQGMGWLTTENLYYENGRLISCTPSTYKIPMIHDIPKNFHCHFFDNSEFKKNLKGSKAVGEPPLLLSISVWTAIKNALNSLTDHPIKLEIPAHQENIFMKLNQFDS